MFKIDKTNLGIALAVLSIFLSVVFYIASDYKADKEADRISQETAIKLEKQNKEIDNIIAEANRKETENSEKQIAEQNAEIAKIVAEEHKKELADEKQNKEIDEIISSEQENSK